jgi:energy-coupling factor transporter ATP-binding protein EcfA2
MRIHLHNIGPVRDADIELTPLTVLVGPNGSGKTTFTTVTYAVIQGHRAALLDALDVVESFDPEGERRRPSPTMAKEIIRRWERSFNNRLEFELQRCCNPDLRTLARARRGGRDAAPRIEVATGRWALVFRIRGDELELERDHRSYRRPALQMKTGTSLTAAKAKTRIALGKEMPRRGIYFPAGRSALVQTHSAMTALLLGAISGGYFEDATIGEIPGPIADFMQMMARLKARRISKAGPTKLVRSIERELLHGRVRLRERGGRKTYVFLPEGQDLEWPLETAATSVGELSPLILYLRHWASMRDAILIDEPEAHLHPEAQVPLAGILLNLVKDVSPVIVATHSDFLVSALSNELLQRASEDEEEVARMLSVHEFRFRDEDRGLGVDARQVQVPADEGFEIEPFAEVADAVFEQGIAVYNRLHAETDV